MFDANSYESPETLRPVDNREQAELDAEQAAEQQEAPEKSPEEQKQEDLEALKKERDNEIRETAAVEEKVFSDEHESMKIVDMVFGKLGESIPMALEFDRSKNDLQGEFKELKVALQAVGELSIAASREVDQEGAVATNISDTIQVIKEKFNEIKVKIEALKPKVEEFVKGVQKGLEEHQRNTKTDMTDERVEMIRMKAMFEDVFRNAEFVAQRWENTALKDGTIDNLSKELGGDAGEGAETEGPEEDRENVSVRLAEGQDAETEDIASKQEIADTASTASEGK